MRLWILALCLAVVGPAWAQRQPTPERSSSSSSGGGSNRYAWRPRVRAPSATRRPLPAADRWLATLPVASEPPPVASQAQVLGEELLLCKLAVYTNLDSGRSSGADDRLAFIIPLIIIYWHHRHPPGTQQAPPSRLQVQELLDALGAHWTTAHERLRLHHVLQLVSHECPTSGADSRIVGPTTPSLYPQPEPDAEPEPRDQSAAAGVGRPTGVAVAEALRALRAWLNHRPAEGPTRASLSERQTNARDFRRWFSSLVASSTLATTAAPAGSAVDTSTVAATRLLPLPVARQPTLAPETVAGAAQRAAVGLGIRARDSAAPGALQGDSQSSLDMDDPSGELYSLVGSILGDFDEIYAANSSLAASATAAAGPPALQAR